MSLHYKLSSASLESPWLVLIHGLFGSADNLSVVRRHFENSHNIISVDLPDHGESPWSDGFDLDTAVSGIIAILDNLKVENAAFLGHSLGGKVAMRLALLHENRVSALIVADIAPVAYGHRHQAVFDGLQAVSLGEINGRSDADKAMSAYIKEPGVRQFLLKSLYKGDDDKWRWRFNVEGLINHYSHIIDWPQDNRQFSGVTLFIKGADSDYITASHRSAIGKYFPNAKAHVIDGTGHWLHAEKPTAFNKVVERALNSI
ncbi:alpha/beta fold hydrolase [Alteromonas sp. 345S023]|uniref:Alpha/beta fold hydrolase n=1 Tax=Alteromonas profundi TaxID=2696062 RepID=A0A7X5RJQ5_9ALTE|nr:alpha/beta fold hydrolase [Alteromonas profundi]NDV90092.1 alpha/beta fold hydrolase [Alteromonas profundi]